MKKIFSLFLILASFVGHVLAQNSFDSFPKNPNPHKVKLYLVNQEVAKGILFSVQQDSIWIADYSKKKGQLLVENERAFEVSKIKMIKTLDPNQIKKGIKTGGTIGVIPGALLGVLAIAYENEFSGDVSNSIPIAIGISATTFGIGAAIGAAIGSNYIEYKIEYSWNNYQKVRNDLAKVAYRYGNQIAPLNSKK